MRQIRTIARRIRNVFTGENDQILAGVQETLQTARDTVLAYKSNAESSAEMYACTQVAFNDMREELEEWKFKAKTCHKIMKEHGIGDLYPIAVAWTHPDEPNLIVEIDKTKELEHHAE